MAAIRCGVGAAREGHYGPGGPTRRRDDLQPAALHDLGVIINQDRIAAAGCQFPLAESGDVDRSLGSRHRAALGMSHEADAVVIVVSEETGTISVAIRGRMRRALTVEALRETLIKELTPAKDRIAAKRSVFAAKAKAAAAGANKSGTGQAA